MERFKPLVNPDEENDTFMAIENILRHFHRVPAFGNLSSLLVDGNVMNDLTTTDTEAANFWSSY